MIIRDIHTKVILDSRGDKTLETQVQTDNFSVKASVPSGKSKGIYEAVSQDPTVAIEKLEMIKHKFIGYKFPSQKSFDGLLIELDGTKDKSNLGVNLILSLSLAYARAYAKFSNVPLWMYINSIFSKRFGAHETSFPHLMFNVINGGVHASPSDKWIMRNNSPKLKIQEFQLIPMVDDLAMALSMGKELYKKLKELLLKRFDKEDIELGDEAGFIAPFESDDDALNILFELIKKYRYPVRIGLDVAASQIFKNEKYVIDNNEYSESQLVEYYKNIANRYNLISIEDPFDENNFNSFFTLLNEFKKEDIKVAIITDDLTTTNPKRIEKAVKINAGNALLVKPNQIGTLSETLQAVSIAYAGGWKTVVSHRSGETTDDFIADLAIGTGAWGIKAGAPETIFRLAKYERLVKIFQSISDVQL